MYKGWVTGSPKDRKHLESLGIELGPYNKAESRFNDCKASSEALAKLDPVRFLWYFVPIKENE